MEAERDPASFRRCHDERFNHQCDRDGARPHDSGMHFARKDGGSDGSGTVAAKREQWMNQVAALEDGDACKDGVAGHIGDKGVAQAEIAPGIGRAGGGGKEKEQHIAFGWAQGVGPPTIAEMQRGNEFSRKFMKGMAFWRG